MSDKIYLKIIWVATLVLMLQPTISVVAQPSQPLIAYVSNQDGNLDVFVMNADGTNPVNLTNNPANDWDPAWTSDGQQIVFVSDRDGNPELYVMNVDGSNVRRLTSTDAADSAPVWQPGITVPTIVQASQTDPDIVPPTPEPAVVEPAAVVPSNDPGVVPALTGMQVPEAAALLNRNGILLGAEMTELWTAVSSAPPNTIGGQSIPPGETVPVGTVMDITILHAPNARLVFDDNDLTLINQSNETLDISNLRFSSIDGVTPAFFAASSRWQDTLRGNSCTQIWSVVRNGPKSLAECIRIQSFSSGLSPDEHFWTGSNRATEFNVAVGGQEAAICRIADQSCEFYIPSVAAAVNVEYIYLAYTTDRLLIRNNTDDSWLPLADVTLYNLMTSESGAPVRIGDPTLYGTESIRGTVERLAPGQCILFTTGERTNPPENCDVIVRLPLNSNSAFWTMPFGVNDPERLCPAPRENELTLCILPRE